MSLVLAALYDNDGMGLILHTSSSVARCAFGERTALTCSSSSMNDGRSLE
ncbi:hypothetical protein A936_01437 [Enterobacter sp. Ag1]|nr:hypothetical protein A936_01437 [Enterobacter sp. Ag1]